MSKQPGSPGPSRREMLRLSALGIGAFSASGWMEVLASRAADAGKKYRSCILLWMDGGPSHHDTFDMKPEAPDSIRGDFRPIATSVPGIQISEKLPEVARVMHHAAIIRSMSTGEAEHGRARIYLHTGYKEGAGGLRYPTMGSLLTAASARSEEAMPSFVVTGQHLNPANWSYVSSPGFLGPRHAPLIVSDPTQGVANLAAPAGDAELSERLALHQEMTRSFLRERPSAAGTAHQTVYARALQLMRSSRSKAFDLSLEPAPVREAYGDCSFGQGCLLARRLVEAGVPFIEVYHAPTPGGWDNHTAQRVKEVKTLALPQLDRGMSTLIRDLEERGLLQETLVVWMGEFGRTPKVNKNGGRDHYARAWTSVVFGGGVRGGQVIGRTDKTGATVEDRPVSAIDFMATVCAILGIDSERHFQAGDRPVRMVERGAQVVRELLPS